MKNLTKLFIALMIITFGFSKYSDAQIYIIDKSNYKTETQLTKDYKQVIDSNSEFSIICDNIEKTSNFVLIDYYWDTNAYYYTISDTEKEISSYGSIIYKSKSHIILKTNIEDLSSQTEFKQLKFEKLINKSGTI